MCSDATMRRALAAAHQAVSRLDRRPCSLQGSPAALNAGAHSFEGAAVVWAASEGRLRVCWCGGWPLFVPSRSIRKNEGDFPTKICCFSRGTPPPHAYLSHLPTKLFHS